MEKYGLNGTAIPKEVISFAAPVLQHTDVIVNTNRIELMWNEHANGFVIITSDFTNFLSDEDIHSPWYTMDGKLYNI